nr:protein SCARECROW-like [Tanacetum cinerariifolium]
MKANVIVSLQSELASPDIKRSLDGDEDIGVDEVSSAIDGVFDSGRSLIVFLKWVQISRSRPLLLMLLSLGLATVIDSSRERKMKRKRRESCKPLDTNRVSEGKMFSLFETREMMLKKENKRREANTLGEDGKGLHLIHLLLVSATSLDENKLDSAVENLIIMEAFEREEKDNNQTLHVVDLDVGYGFQWPSLMQSLSDKATTGNLVSSLRITGFGRTLEELEETEARLVGSVQ